MDVPSEFSSSRLGSKEYWDEHYRREITNFEETGDEGEIWFGVAAEREMIKFLCGRFADVAARSNLSMVELGTGNGSLLRWLWNNGFRGRLCGVDYSENALALARRACEVVGADKGRDEIQMEFHCMDLVADEAEEASSLQQQFDCVLDKGTWDAISLAANDAEARLQLLQNYCRSVAHMFKRGDPENTTRNERYFVIISCNFTSNELSKMFSSDCMKFYAEIKTANSITFGGKSGETFNGAAFRFNG